VVHREVGWMRNCPSGVSFLLIRGVSCNDTMTTLVFLTNSSSLSLLFPVNIYTKSINHNVSILSLPHRLPLPLPLPPPHPSNPQPIFSSSTSLTPLTFSSLPLALPPNHPCGKLSLTPGKPSGNASKLGVPSLSLCLPRPIPHHTHNTIT
jgi:hypothetical protein